MAVEDYEQYKVSYTPEKLDLFEKSADKMTEDELFDNLMKLHFRIMMALQEDDKNSAIFNLGASVAVANEIKKRYHNA